MTQHPTTPHRPFDAPEPPAGPPRDAGSPGVAALCWVIIAALIGLVLFLHRAAPPAPTVASVPVEPPNAMLTLLGRYAVGAKSIIPSSEESGLAPIVTQLDTIADGYADDQLRAAIIAGELIGPDSALERINSILEEHPFAPSDGPPTDGAPTDPTALAEDDSAPLSPELLADLELVRAIFRGDAVDRDPAANAGFVERHGFFADVALSQGSPSSDPLRVSIVSRGQRTTAVMLAGLFTLVGLGILGFVVGIFAVAWFAKGRIRAAYAPPTPGGSVYLETFALFLFTFLAINLAAAPLEQALGADPTPYLIWIVPLVGFYPLLRGVPWSRHRYAIGWHSGRGVVREIGAAIMGYLAGVPIVAAGVGLTFLLMMLSNMMSPGEPTAPPTHPIMDKFGTGGWQGLAAIFLLASIWAPLTEESLFRGALYHHLRGRLRPFFGALVVGLLFAVVHPQGFIAIPALASLGFVFSLMREWRGSLIAPMLAHGVHNGAIMVALWLALS